MLAPETFGWVAKVRVQFKLWVPQPVPTFIEASSIIFVLLLCTKTDNGFDPESEKESGADFCPASIETLAGGLIEGKICTTRGAGRETR